MDWKYSGVCIFIFLILISHLSFAQDDHQKTDLTLEKVVELAVSQSSSIKNVQNQNENSFWRWKNFQARFRPQLTIAGDLPDYEQTNTPVVQPDGSIEFRQIAQMQTNARLALSQVVPQTGTSIYAASSLYRVQDYNKNTLNFSGSPVYLGFTQPLFAYNWMKWSRKTEPLIYEESQKQYAESIENISLNATRRFFTYLQIQTNYNLATSSLKNSKDNLKIAEVKRKLGRISENDYSRIELSVLNAKKAVNKSSIDLKNADFELKSYIGLDQSLDINLVVPLDMTLFYVDPKKALQETLDNRKETPEYKRRLLEAERDLTYAKRSTGLSTTLTGSFGLSNSAESVSGVFDNPEKQRLLKLSLSIPILDWGKSASAVKLAESRRDLVTFAVEKDRTDFEREVVVQVEQFNLLKDQMLTAKEADKVAENGYKIALKKFQNGEISITDLNISLSERESAKRDYIASIESYWESYYEIRILTLYDFIDNKKLTYHNPILNQ